jgi:hypothetical protein
MSTNYRSDRKISIIELFDGRLENHGVYEKIVEGKASNRMRFLTDGSNGLWIYGDETFDGATRYGLGNAPGGILAAIETTSIFLNHISGHAPRYLPPNLPLSWYLATSCPDDSADCVFGVCAHGTQYGHRF